MQKDNYITISGKSVSSIGLLEHINPSVKSIHIKSLSVDPREIFSGPRIAIVGSRKVSSYGSAVTKKLSYDLAKAGLTIVSGLALGVDSLSHRGAVEAGGRTIAVLPCSISSIYPRSHTSLARQIISSNSKSALISEYDGNSSPMKHHFLARNRIIAGISDALLITEAATRSGSLSTANHALELGIPVMAIPGPIDSPMSQGTNNLIKAGAHLVTNVGDILSIMGLDATENIDRSEYEPADDLEKQVIQLIKENHKDTNQIIKHSTLGPEQVQQTLTMLEIKGVVRSNDYFTWHLL